jgi:hypothetical protein
MGFKKFVSMEVVVAAERQRKSGCCRHSSGTVFNNRRLTAEKQLLVLHALTPHAPLHFNFFEPTFGHFFEAL